MKEKEPAVVHRKLAILGFRAVGKSSLTNAFVTGSFSEPYDPTIENTYHKIVRFRKVHFATDIVDTAGMVGILAPVFACPYSVPPRVSFCVFVYLLHPILASDFHF